MFGLSVLGLAYAQVSCAKLCCGWRLHEGEFVREVAVARRRKMREDELVREVVMSLNHVW